MAAKKRVATVHEWKKQVREIYESREGCNCPNVIKGKVVPANERCNKSWIRCNGVIRVLNRKLKKLGPCPTQAKSKGDPDAR